jgi:hypothetical protein
MAPFFRNPFCFLTSLRLTVVAARPLDRPGVRGDPGPGAPRRLGGAGEVFPLVLRLQPDPGDVFVAGFPGRLPAGRGPHRQPGGGPLLPLPALLEKSGIWLTHLGLILLLVGEGVSGILQQDNQMRIDVGQTQALLGELPRDGAGNHRDHAPRLRRRRLDPRGATHGRRAIQHPNLPFVVKPWPTIATRCCRTRAPRRPMRRRAWRPRERASTCPPCPCRSRPSRTRPTGQRAMSSWSDPGGRSARSRLDHADEPDDLHLPEDRTWRLVLRARRDYLPCTITWRSSPTRSIRGPTFPGTSRAPSGCAATTAATTARCGSS